MNERRWKLVYVSEQDLLFSFHQWHRQIGDCIMLRHGFDALPEDARVVRVYYEPTVQAWAVVIESESFEPVEEGDAIPRLGKLCKLRDYEVLVYQGDGIWEENTP